MKLRPRHAAAAVALCLSAFSPACDQAPEPPTLTEPPAAQAPADSAPGGSAQPAAAPSPAEAAPAAPQALAGPAGTDVAALITWLLENRDNLDSLPFSGIIKAATGHAILPLDHEDDEVSAEIHQALSTVMNESIAVLSAEDSPVRGLRRINEASKFFEEEMMARLNDHPDFTCDFPPNAEGSAQRSGYPDLRLVHTASGRISYIDPKLFEDSSVKSSLRTFYFEPKVETNKVLEDAHHLLVGIAHDGEDGRWTFTNWHMVDLSAFEVRLKAEFQASNKDLYREELIVGEGGEPAAE